LVPIEKTRLKSTEHFHILLCSGTKLDPQVEGDKNGWSHSTYRSMKMHINFWSENLKRSL